MDLHFQVILPPIFLEMLVRSQSHFPYTFKITNLDARNQRVTHAGVLEFSGEKGCVYVAEWVSAFFSGSLAHVHGPLICEGFR